MSDMITPMYLYYKDTDILKLQEIWSQYPELIGKHEIWKPITKFIIPTIIEGWYFISTYGRVYSIKSNKFLTQVETDNGYFRVSLMEEGKKSGRYHLLHRLVLKTFYPIPNDNLFQVNHIDGIKSHNWYWNLEWVTCYENIHHAMDTGLRIQVGENHYNHSITEETADKIGFLLSSSDMTAKEIASLLGTTERTVFNIMSGNCWRHIYEKYNLFNINRNPRVLDTNNIHRIC